MIDFVKYISENTPKLTAAKKKAMLEDLAESLQYPETAYDHEKGAQIPNPQSKADYVNEKITYWIKIRVMGTRRERAAKAQIIEELDI